MNFKIEILKKKYIGTKYFKYMKIKLHVLQLYKIFQIHKNKVSNIIVSFKF